MARKVTPRLKVTIVSNEYGACPRCGAYWGHPDPNLDFPNRQKVDDSWKCYNPNCTCGYYIPGQGVVEDKLSPDEEEALRAQAREWIKTITFGKEWTETSPNCWQLTPKKETNND